MSLSNSSNPLSPNKTQILSLFLTHEFMFHDSLSLIPLPLSVSLSIPLSAFLSPVSLSSRTHKLSASQIPIFIIVHSCLSVFPSPPPLLISVISYIFFMDVGSIAQENLHNISFSIVSCKV